MDEEKIKGYADQELLFRAILKFLSAQINRSEQITAGLMKQCLQEWSRKNNMTIKEIKNHDEPTRLRFVGEMFDLFIDKIKHLVESKLQRDKIKNNMIQIYEQWKKTHRKDATDTILSEMDILNDK